MRSVQLYAICTGELNPLRCGAEFADKLFDLRCL